MSVAHADAPQQHSMKRLFWKLFLAFLVVSITIEIAHIAASDSVALFGIVLLMILCMSSFAAWYLAQPIAILRRAFSDMSAGQFDTRVRHLLGNRSAVIADLGGDFDSMAQCLQEYSSAQRRLIHEASHELRSPLTRLQIAIGLAQRDPEGFLANLDRIESESLKLQGLLENMLMLAQLQHGAELPMETIDLYDLVATVVRDAQFEAKALQRDVVLQDSAPCYAHVNTGLVSRAIDNILRNAIKYTAPETTIDVFVRCDTENFHIDICDCGPGVDDSATLQIFEPFYRAANQHTAAQGYGLGLAIARNAIELHGGSIRASNRAGGGLQVSIALPLQQYLETPRNISKNSETPH